MAKNKDETIVDVVEVVSKTERYIDENQKSLTIIISAIVILIAMYFIYTKWYIAEEELNAQREMYMAEIWFERDSLDLAIYGDMQWPGFEEIVDEYSITPSGNLANYYLGICYLRKGMFEDAIESLSAFDSDDLMVSSVATGAIGDAYMELGEVKTAASFYMDAANDKENDFTSPIYLMKAAAAYEELENYKKALGIYENIKKNYADTKEGLEVEKYLERAKSIVNAK
ncbi:MAG TPA: tetratricopeptide repeat protein [Flavobacteriales bacterium]|nr:tetratricopeptide repeat protein [Flavobacteriales bacterium]HIO68056.1 tetratricopeptide repeat protein [Flavobacteriales bacterium]